MANKYQELAKKYYILVILILFCISLQYLCDKNFQSLPSPLYGGDYYFQLGAVNHVRYGGSALDSSNINGGSPAYFVTYAFIVGGFARIFGMDALAAEYLFSYIFMALGIIVMYILLQKLFNNKFIPAIGTLMYIGACIPIIKYTNFAQVLVMPLLILLLYNFLHNKNIINAILVGLCYGFIGITHSIAFITASLFLAITFIYYEIIVDFKEKSKERHKYNLKKIFQIIKPYAIVAIIGILIAMLWWYKPIFVHHGVMSPHYMDWNSSGLSRFSDQIGFFWTTFRDMLFNFSDLRYAMLSIFTIIGIVGLFLVKDKDKHKSVRFIKFAFFSSIIIVLHYFITQNFLGTNFAPSYVDYLLVNPCTVLMACLGIYFLYHLIPEKEHKDQEGHTDKDDNHLWRNVLLIGILVIVGIGQITEYSSWKENQWYKSGVNPVPVYLLSLKDYLVKNTAVDTTVLTTKEVGFAVNGITGRKLLISRRAHNDPFMDMDSRELAASIILYGNNTELKKSLIKQYNISYLYWDYYWIQSEYNINAQGQITGWFDPMLMFDDPAREKILTDNKVAYAVQNTWVDPAIKGDSIKTFDLIFITPNNYHNFTNPWNPELNPYLTEVWSYSDSGSKIAALYKINMN